MHRRLFLLSGLCGLCFSGCGGSDDPRRHALRGTVTVNGTSVAKGSISFLPSQGVAGPPATTVIEAGEYRFTSEDGPFAGEHRVVIGIELEPDVANEAVSTTSPGGLSSGIKVAPPPADFKRSDPRLPKSTSPKTQWEVPFKIEEDADHQKDFNLDG